MQFLIRAFREAVEFGYWERWDMDSFVPIGFVILVREECPCKDGARL
jgi:hypothetical protein